MEILEVADLNQSKSCLRCELIWRPVGTGFTLIELLVVIAVISILAAILFPAFVAATVAAKAAKAKFHGRELGLATSMYLGDSDGIYPLAAYATPTDFRTWQDLLMPYVKSNEIWWYPDSTVSKFDSDGKPTTHWVTMPVTSRPSPSISRISLPMQRRVNQRPPTHPVWFCSHRPKRASPTLGAETTESISYLQARRIPIAGEGRIGCFRDAPPWFGRTITQAAA